MDRNLQDIAVMASRLSIEAYFKRIGAEVSMESYVPRGKIARKTGIPPENNMYVIHILVLP